MVKEMAGCRFDDLSREIFIWNFQSNEKPLFNLCLGRDGAKSTLVHNGIEYNFYTHPTLPLNNDCIEILFLSYEYSYAFAYLTLLKNLFDKYHIRMVLDVFGYMYVFSILL